MPSPKQRERQRIYAEIESIDKSISNEAYHRNLATRKHDAPALALSEMILAELRKHRSELQRRLPKASRPA